MDSSYLEGRLRLSIAMMNGAADRCARIAHRKLADGYRALIAAAKPTAHRLPREDGKDALARWSDDGGAPPAE